MSHLAIQGQRFHGSVGFEHDGTAGGFVAASGLHTDVTVLDDVIATDTIGTTHPIQFRQHLGGGHLPAIDGDNIPIAKAQLDIRGGVRGCLGADAPAPHGFFRLSPGILK